MRPALLAFLPCAAALAGCAHNPPAVAWQQPTGSVSEADCAVYATIAPTLGDARKYLLHPVTIPSLVREQVEDPGADQLPGFSSADVERLENERLARTEEALKIECDWRAYKLPVGAFAWRSARSYDLAFSPVLRNADGKLAVVEVHHNDTFGRGVRTFRYLVGEEAGEWRIAGFFTIAYQPRARVQVGPIERTP